MKKKLVAKNELGIYADGNGVVRADSLVVAQIFEKRHDNVVRDIRNLTVQKSSDSSILMSRLTSMLRGISSLAST